MRWKTGRRSQKLEDRRGIRVSRRGIAGSGIGTVVVVLVALYPGVDPSVILQGMPPEETSQSAVQPYQSSPREQTLADFTSVMLADTEDTWHEIFRRSGEQYREPGLVLFSGAVQSACGVAAASAIGDDRIQKQSQGHVVPDAFTHGSSAQRVRWFKRGLESGNPNHCDTFNASEL